jgi:hypothetical protein
VDAVADKIDRAFPDDRGHLPPRGWLDVNHSTVPVSEELRC